MLANTTSVSRSAHRLRMVREGSPTVIRHRHLRTARSVTTAGCTLAPIAALFGAMVAAPVHALDLRSWDRKFDVASERF
jgi:hypothetical protein